MANLLAHSAEGVRRRYEQADSYLSAVRRQEDKALSDALWEMINALREQERMLYKRLGVGNYAGLNDKLDKIKINELDFLLSTGSIVKHYLRNYVFPKSASAEEAVDLLRGLLEENSEELVEVIGQDFCETRGEDITEEAVEYLRKFFRGKRRGSRSGYLRIFGKHGERVGIGKLTFGVELETDGLAKKPKITARFRDGSDNFSSQLIDKVIAALAPEDKLALSVAFPTREDFKKDVSFLIVEQAPPRWRSILHTVMKEFDDNGNPLYGVKEITRSYAGLVGYLGEVRAQAILYYLFGDNAFGTGALKEEAEKSRDISIDMIVKQGFNYLGFQVKNYTLAEDKATFSYSMSTLNFIQNRLCLTGKAEEILGDLFGTYEFNQPFTKPSLVARYENSPMTVQEYKEDRYSEVSRYVNNLHDLILSRLGYVLRMGHEFSIASGQEELDRIFGSKKMYYNSFFMIEKELIPSSIILEAIAAQIEKGQLQNSALVTYSIPLSRNTLESTFNENTGTFSGRVPQKNAILGKQRINYDIILDVAQLKQKALSQI